MRKRENVKSMQGIAKQWF